MAHSPLAGLTIAVTADRRREEQVELLRRRGAAVVEAPTIRTVPLVDDDGLRCALHDVVREPPQVTVLTTGVGARGMFVAAEGLGLDDAFTAALRGSTVLARGPKAAGAAVAAGLEPAWRAPGERSAEIVDHLRHVADGGARIVVQRDGGERPLLAEQLAALGADVVDVPVYRWVLPGDLAPIHRLVGLLAGGAVDAVTFTSTPAVRNLLEVAVGMGRHDAVLRAFADRVLAICVGPVCAESAARVGIERRVTPRRARLGAMVQAATHALSGRGHRFCHAGTEVLARGTMADVGGRRVELSERERSVLGLLLEARGAVVPKAELLRVVWGEVAADEHLVEVTVARLRRRLAGAGGAVVTVPRRGYRIVAEVAPELT